MSRFRTAQIGLSAKGLSSLVFVNFKQKLSFYKDCGEQCFEVKVLETEFKKAKKIVDNRVKRRLLNGMPFVDRYALSLLD